MLLLLFYTSKDFWVKFFPNQPDIIKNSHKIVPLAVFGGKVIIHWEFEIYMSTFSTWIWKSNEIYQILETLLMQDFKYKV